MKRLLDVCISLTGVILLALPMLLIAGLIAGSSPGGVLFRQTRVGRCGRPFKILKFRTMRPSAGGAAITRAGDPRITPVGAFLRRSKLDELPQLFNVLKGDMSLVGPRPEVPQYIEKYSDDQRSLILSVRPGITDLAAIHFRDEESILQSAGGDMEKVYIEEVMPIKFKFYSEYINTRSDFGDLKIIFETLWAVIDRSWRHPQAKGAS